MRYLLATLFFITATGVGAAAEKLGGREIVDALGAHVRLVETPARVVTLIPSLGELAADLCDGKFERILAVSNSTDYPPALTTKPSVGPYPHLNLEKILALKPDLVLATQSGNSKDQIEHLRELGVPVVVVRTESFAEIQESILLVGRAMGAGDTAAKLLSRFQTGLAHFKSRGVLHEGARKRVLLQVGESPLVVVGGKSYLSEALEWVGARNIFSDLPSAYPRPSFETLLQRDPDAILILALGNDPGYFVKMQHAWNEHPKLKAVKSNAVQLLQADELLRPSLRLLEGLGRLEKVIYP